MGRHKTIESPERMDELVRDYQAQCVADEQPLTLTGMILHLGLSSRQSLDEYNNYEGFSDSVKRAKLLIESEYEKRLSGHNATGSIFALKNFGWRDKQDHELTGANGGPIENTHKIERVIVRPKHSDS